MTTELTTTELTTRGPFDNDPGLLVKWMLKSGQPAQGNQFGRIRTGIQLYVPHSGGVAVVELADVHEAGDLYVALEAHMENIAGPDEEPVQNARMASEDDQRGNVPATFEPDARTGFDAALDARNAEAAGVDAEFLGAMADVVEAWTTMAPGRRTGLYLTHHALAAALDRLAALNA